MRHPPRQWPLPFQTAPDHASAVFIAAPSNAEARAWLDRPPEWPDRRLLVWGEPGCGKTHLLHQFAARHAAEVACGPTLRWPSPHGPGAAGAGTIVVDDADAAPEEALLHLMNAAGEAGLTLLLAARLPPSRWPGALADLASRARAMTAVEIQPPDDDLLRGLLARLFTDRQLAVAAPIQEFLLLRLPRTPHALREAAARLDRAALASGGAVTRPMAAAIVDEVAPMWQGQSS